MLSDLLNNAARRVIEIAREKGIGPELPRYPYLVQWWEQVVPNQWTYKQEERSQPDVAFFWFHFQDELAETLEFKALQDSIQSFADSNGKFPVFFGHGLVSGFGQIMVMRYFEAVGRFAIDESLAESICRSFENNLMADTFAIRATFLVHGFACDSAFRLSDDVACRPISATDIDSFARSSFGPMDVFLNESSNRVYDTDWIFQIDANIDKQDMSSANGLAEAIDDVIVAMNLTTGGRTHFSMVEKKALSTARTIIVWFGA